MVKKTILWALLLCCGLAATGQVSTKKEIPFLKDENWWGAFVAQGSQMPYLKPTNEFNLETQNFNNQGVPLFVSDKGRYIWSDEPFRFRIAENAIEIKSGTDNVEVVKAGNTLREAYLAACHKHFPPTGTLPDSLLFSMPQYNTWIELMYNQNQKDILNYADHILKNGYPAGVLMVDDNWQKYYGNFEFKSDKFPDAKGMIDQLHAKGFKIMVWVCPFVSPDSPEFRELQAKGYLMKRKGSGEPALFGWWNGYSACYDLTNPAAFDHYVAKLKEAQERYGIDGFKFDAGDVMYYAPVAFDSYVKGAKTVDHSQKWAEIGLHFPFNEYRASWKMGGQPLVQRLGDKNYSWRAVGLLIPDMIAAGLLGYAYTCPDMIGGGQFSAFLNVKKFDEPLIVRSAQTHALMPMMQFSVAPWRILSPENNKICADMARLHAKKGNYILACARQSAQTGEPIVRHMEYMFPGQGFANCKDQFMLGDKYLVAPVITPENTRQVKLPKGKWRDDLGKIWSGGKVITIQAGLERLPYFEKIK